MGTLYQFSGLDITPMRLVAGKLQKYCSEIVRKHSTKNRKLGAVAPNGAHPYMYYDIGNTGELEVFGDPSYDSYFKQLCI